MSVEDVALGRDQDPEVGPPALLLGLDEDADLLLAGYKGYLVADAATVYDHLSKNRTEQRYQDP